MTRLPKPHKNNALEPIQSKRKLQRQSERQRDGWNGYGAPQDGGKLIVLTAPLTETIEHAGYFIQMVVFGNGCYESSRGAPTATAGVTDLAAMAKGAGLVNATTANEVKEFTKKFL
ncbi:MAG: hypothetical protein HY652_08435 [Acidobacteria bacterium]|nr:hypothetical protein [Acidobacteriota bacterium]